MTSIVSQVYTNLKSLVAAQTTYTELSHVFNLSKNRFKTPCGRYGVLIRDTIEVQGSTQRLTHDRRFSVILINSYVTDSVDDSSIVQKQITLIGEFDKIYKEAINTKLGLPSIVMNISTFDISEPIIVEEEKLIMIEGSVTVRTFYNL